MEYLETIVDDFRTAMAKLAKIENQTEMMSDLELEDLKNLLIPIVMKYHNNGYEFVKDMFVK